MKTPAILQAFQNQILPANAQLLQADDPVEVGGHRLAGRLPSSGAGVVYLARDRAGGLVTIKTTHAGTTDHGRVRARLSAEAACSRGLPASCTARLLHDGTDRTPPYLVGEYLGGPSLERVVDVRGPLSPSAAGAFAADLAETLTTVHESGLVHGNLTPANVLLTRQGLRIVDFGVAQEISTSGEPAEIGAVADNPGWLAPELLTGGPPSPACDVFGWGCVVAYAATGHSPDATTPRDLDSLDEPVRGLVAAAVGEDLAGRPAAASLTTLLAADPPSPPDDALPEEPAPVRRPRRARSRAALGALLAVGAALFAVPSTSERPFATPPPRTRGPVAPPQKAHPPPKRRSNMAARSVNDAPPPSQAAKQRGGRSLSPRLRPSAPPKIWMSCSNRHPGWCSLSEKPPDDPTGWQFSWVPGG
ncbi:protein kinase [Actinomadura sp. DC4]|uniref:serine/threonine protein kinase n=1 Tax=Actinomadura sp. DC4 TaxID=3055069 RepID=UPI0025AFAD17|nr:protein kinase [Actinomadura sp. DC4]MDN3354056.1 protein kinase [Actinomadura sp. DC4]